jgi:hypothetical protein
MRLSKEGCSVGNFNARQSSHMPVTTAAKQPVIQQSRKVQVVECGVDEQAQM